MTRKGRSWSRAVAALAAGALVSAGCGPSQAADPSPSPDSARTADAAPVQLVSDLDDADVPAVAGAVNQFGFELFEAVSAPGENTVISPVSVATLLAMVAAGADGVTAAEMVDVLGLENARDARVGALLDRLIDVDDVTVSTGNALWADEGVPIEADYVDVVSDVFDATVETAELDDQATADAIDAWVAERTEGLIETIADGLGLPDPNAVLVLVNAVYFLGEWTTQFDPADTKDQPFTVGSGATVDVPTMHLRDTEFAMAAGDGFRMLRMPYGDDGRFGMEIVLPDGGADLSEVLAGLDANSWRAMTTGLEATTVDEVAFPRFEVRWDGQLAGALIDLGMGSAFGAADFSRMSPAADSLSAVVHKTYLRVDEAGTEAAAVTGGTVTTSVPADPTIFRVDRPFAFAVSDSQTGAILFLGSIADPTAES